MAVKARGRGAAAAIGLFLLLAGLVGGGVLYLVALQRPERAVSGFARAPVGCTTTLDFTETGTFFVYAESSRPADAEVVECTQVASPGVELDASFPGDLVPESAVPDDSVSYDVGGYEGRAIRRIEVSETGQYEVAVVGEDVDDVAAIGRDPDEGVATLRRNAIVLAVVGTFAGLVLLLLSGRRSRRARRTAVPDGPGWSTGLTVTNETPPPTPQAPTPRAPSPEAPSWPPKAPQLDQVPVGSEPARSTRPSPPEAAPTVPPQPPQPPEPPEPPSETEAVAVPPEPAPLETRVRQPKDVSWQPPSGDAAEGLPAPVTPPVVPPPPPPPARDE